MDPLAHAEGTRTAMTELRASGAPQAFLLELSDALRPLDDPAKIRLMAARLLGRHLGASRVAYVDDVGDGERHEVTPSSVDGAANVGGRYRYEDYGPDILDDLRTGRVRVQPDIQHDMRLSDTQKQSLADAGVGASLNVPLVKSGQLVAILGIDYPEPHDFPADEIDLVLEVAERTWAAVERARVEAALRVTEARFRTVAELVPDLLWEVEPDGSTSWFNERWAEYSGQTLDEALRRGWMGLIHPDDRERSAASYAKAIATGETLVQEHRFRRHDGAYRWFLIRAEPLRDKHGGIVRWFVAATDINAQRMALEEAERLAAERTAERDALRQQLFEAEEVERRRLARELHDEAGQHLTAIALGLQTLSDMTPPGSEVDRRATQLRALVATMSRELHSLAVRLRPKSLDDFGLEAALAAYAEEWSRQTRIAVGVHARGGADRLPSAIESAIYRVVQEALTNVARHSGASRASVIVERHGGQVVAIVEDDGRGFDVDALSRSAQEASGLGLRGIRERAALLGGMADFESTPGGGTTVFVRIPIGASTTVPTGARRDAP